ncbi:MAG: hypothetical protein OHK0019_09420 [Saprospiraceae bacterium]
MNTQEVTKGITVGRPGAKRTLKPIHYVMWQIGPGGMELMAMSYTEHFFQQRKMFAYGLRPTWKQIFDESKTQVSVSGEGQIQPYRQYFDYCCQHKNDIFHMMNGGPLVLVLTLLAGVKSIVYHIHGTIYWKTAFQKLYLKTTWRIARWFMRGANISFIANSQYSAQVFREKVMPVLPQVIYNGLDVQKFAAKKTLRTELRRICYAGRLWDGKNVDLVIRLFEEIAASHPNTELHLAGDGPLRPGLEEQARQSPFASRIHFHGYVKDIASFYNSADLFVFLSAYESFGNVIAEALLSGLPTLTSNLPVFEEIFGEEKNFILGNPKNYEEIKTNFLKAVKDFPRLARKAHDLSTSVEQKCSMEHHLHQIETVYEKH